MTDFYPRPPRGGRRASSTSGPKTKTISIHALREEGDNHPAIIFSFFHNFYPRPPRGGRHIAICHYKSPFQFLSTPSARRATWLSKPDDDSFKHFYPRPPRGGRQQKRRITSPLLSYYTRFCTVLKELFLHEGTKKTILRSRTGILWCEAPGSLVRACLSHRGTEACYRISTPSCSKAGCRPMCSTLLL